MFYKRFYLHSSLIIIFLFLAILTRFGYTQQNAPTNVPCWFEAPAENGPTGQIGMSRTLSAGLLTPKKISQIRAIDALCHSKKNAVCTDDTLNTALEQKQLFGQPLHFDHYEIDGHIYSYVSLSPIKKIRNYSAQYF